MISIKVWMYLLLLAFGIMNAFFTMYRPAAKDDESAPMIPYFTLDLSSALAILRHFIIP
jgi:hypothetical protein